MLRLAALGSLLIAGLLLGGSIGLGGVGLRGGPDDVKNSGAFQEAYLSDETRQAHIDALRSRNAEWVREFVEQGRDPRSLPVESGETYSPGVRSFDEAREKSRQAIEGRVVSTMYELSPDSHLATSIATVEVIRTSPGTLVEDQVEIVQIGGPAWREDGIGALQQLEGDPLLLPGDHVVLLLVPACAAERNAWGRYQTVFGAGIYYVMPDGLRAPRHSALEGRIEELTAADLLSMFDQDPGRTDNPLCHGV